MNVLLIEDNKDLVDAIQDTLNDLDLAISLDCALSRDSAFSQLSANDYDLIICDLKIPTHDNALDLDVQHGMAVWDFINSEYPGMPTLVLSGFATLELSQEVIKGAKQDDLFGKNNPIPLHGLIQKKDLNDAIELIKEHAHEHRILDDIQITTPKNLQIIHPDEKILRICARRLDSIKISLKELPGGLSDSRTYQLVLHDRKENLRGSLFAKIDNHMDINDEANRLRQYGVPMLDIGNYAPLADLVSSGGGKYAGLFFKLERGFDKSLFDMMENQPESLSAVVRNVSQIETPWKDAAYEETLSIKAIRESFLKDETVLHMLPESLDWKSFEQNSVRCRIGHQHGDLHPANILVNSLLKPILIDFSEAVAERPIITDPLLLEMAMLFHPAGRQFSNGWPTEENISNWADIENYLVDCPLPSFIKACREWTMSEATDRQDIIAVAYAHTVRQLQYSVLDHQKIFTLVRTLMNAFY